MMHFAQAGIALVAGGASVLIIAGLVRESVRDGGRHLHLFPDAHDDHEMAAAKAAETTSRTTSANNAGPFPHSRGDDARRSKRDVDVKDRATRKRRKEKRRSKKRNGSDGRADAVGRATAAETDDA